MAFRGSSCAIKFGYLAFMLYFCANFITINYSNMNKILGFSIMCVSMLTSCATSVESETVEKPWVVDRFDDIKVIRYEVPGFEELSLEEKELIYYLAEAAKCGRDILFDQNFKYNLAVRRTQVHVHIRDED